MSYFNRSRTRSKPSEDETQQLRDHLTKCSDNELRLIILSAAYESSDVARRITKAMRDIGLIQPTIWSSEPPTNHNAVGITCASNAGLLTPTDISDDSEMSGTENIQPESQNHPIHSRCFSSTTSYAPAPGHSQPETSSLKSSNKRKTFADRDNNSPHSSTSILQPPPIFTRKRKPIFQPSEITPPPEKIHCVNCGTWTSGSTFENLHSCIYHPGTFEFNGKVTSWSCCSNNNLKSRGCLITQHKGLNQDAWLFGSYGANGLYGGQQGVHGMGGGNGTISQYARLISSKA